MKKATTLFLMGILALGILAAGCNKPAKEDDKQPAASEKQVAEKPAPEAPAVNTSTWQNLCETYAREFAVYRTDMDIPFTDQDKQEWFDSCMAVAGIYESSTVADTIEKTYVDIILNACSEKKGEEFVDCVDRSEATDKASEAANDLYNNNDTN